MGDRAGQAYHVTGRGDISNRIHHLENIFLSLGNPNARSQSQMTELSGSLLFKSGTDGGQVSSEASQSLATGKGNTINSPGMMLTFIWAQDGLMLHIGKPF